MQTSPPRGGWVHRRGQLHPHDRCWVLRWGRCPMIKLNPSSQRTSQALLPPYSDKETEAQRD